MQLPIDVTALRKEASNIEEARETELAVSVYIDESAPSDLVAHVRNAFASTVPNVRMTVTYLDSSFFPHPNDDFAVIVAGDSLVIGASAAAVRAVGVPVMVVTTCPGIVGSTAQEENNAIPDGDMIAPVIEEGQSEPVELSELAGYELDERMGKWLISVIHDKRLALSIAFPFMRRAMARDAVQVTSWQNAGVGLVPFLPGADLPIMTLNQAKMVLQIASAYGRELNKDRLKELLAVVGTAYISRTLVRELVEFIPVLGFVFRTGIAYASTSALGYAVIEYYEGGGDATGVANVISKAGETGQKAISWVTETVANPSSVSFDKPVDALNVVRNKVGEYAPKAVELVQDVAPGVTGKVGEYATKIVDVAGDKAPKLVDAASEYAPKVADLVADVLTGAVSKTAS